MELVLRTQYVDPDILDNIEIKKDRPLISTGAEEVEALLKAADLTDKQREVCFLYYLGMNQEDIAALLNISQPAVHYRLRAAERRLCND